MSDETTPPDDEESGSEVNSEVEPAHFFDDGLEETPSLHAAVERARDWHSWPCCFGDGCGFPVGFGGCFRQEIVHLQPLPAGLGSVVDRQLDR